VAELTKQTANEDLVVASALDVLVAKGWLVDGADEQLVSELHHIHQTNATVRFSDGLPHDKLAACVGEHLAGTYERERQEEWERSLPAWSCDCGRAYKVVAGGLPSRPDDEFYALRGDGLPGELVGTSRGVGISRNKSCLTCGREFARTVARQADPQLPLFLDG